MPADPRAQLDLPVSYTRRTSSEFPCMLNGRCGDYVSWGGRCFLRQGCRQCQAEQRPSLPHALELVEPNIGLQTCFLVRTDDFLPFSIFCQIDKKKKREKRIKCFLLKQNLPKSILKRQRPKQAIIKPPQSVQDPHSIYPMCSSTQSTHPLYSTALES